MNKILVISILAIILLSSVFTINSAFGADLTKEAKKMHPKMFQVYLNNLDSNYTLTKSTNKESADGGFVSHSAQYFATKNGHEIITHAMTFATADGGRMFFDIETRDIAAQVNHVAAQPVHTFQLSKEEKCIIKKTNVFCLSGKYGFSVSSDITNGEQFKFMDIMLKKYYKAQGKVFKESTKQLSEKATLVPVKEKTYQELVNSLVAVKLISCSNDDYISWKGSVTSLANVPINVHITLTGEKKNGEIMTFEKELILSLYPSQTEYVDRLLDNVSGDVYCGYRVERVDPS